MAYTNNVLYFYRVTAPTDHQMVLCADTGEVARITESNPVVADKIADLLVESGWTLIPPPNVTISNWLLRYNDTQGEQEEEICGPQRSAIAAAISIKKDIGREVSVWRKTLSGWILESRI